MPDKNDRPSAIVVRKIVMPALHHACVGDVFIPFLVKVVVQQCGERALAIHRRPHVAHARERRSLSDRNVAFRRLQLEVGVVGCLVAHGRIDIETVERRAYCLRPVRNARHFSRSHDGRRERHCAWIVGHAGPAQPHRCSKADAHAHTVRVAPFCVVGGMAQSALGPL